MEQLGNDIYLQMYKQGKALFNCLLNRDVLDGHLKYPASMLYPRSPSSCAFANNADKGQICELHYN